MIIDLLKYLTRRNGNVNIASDGLRNPKISGDHDIVILNDDSNMTGCYTLYNTSQGERCIGSTDFGFLTSRHHLYFRKLKSGTNMSTSISSLYQDYQQLSGFLSYYSGSDELGDKLYALQDFICDRIICTHATTPAELLIKLELFKQQVKQESFYKDYQDLAQLLESSLIDLRNIA